MGFFEKLLRDIKNPVSKEMEELEAELIQLEMYKYTEGIVRHIYETGDLSVPDDTLEIWANATDYQKTIVFFSLLGIIQGLME